jgi:hypothetical protein
MNHGLRIEFADCPTLGRIHSIRGINAGNREKNERRDGYSRAQPGCDWQLRELISTSFATVFRFLEVPSFAAGICNFDFPIPVG